MSINLPQVRVTFREISRFRFDLYKHTRSFREGPFQEKKRHPERIAFGILSDGRKVFCYLDPKFSRIQDEVPKPREPKTKKRPRFEGRERKRIPIDRRDDIE